MERRSTGLAILYWLFCFLGICGLHRFYVGHYLIGFIYLITFGLCFVGQLLDLLFVREMVDNFNSRHSQVHSNSQLSSSNDVTININPSTSQEDSLNEKRDIPKNDLTDEQLLLDFLASNGWSSIGQICVHTNINSEILDGLLERLIDLKIVRIMADDEGRKYYNLG